MRGGARAALTAAANEAGVCGQGCPGSVAPQGSWVAAYTIPGRFACLFIENGSVQGELKTYELPRLTQSYSKNLLEFSGDWMKGFICQFNERKNYYG